MEGEEKTDAPSEWCALPRSASPSSPNMRRHADGRDLPLSSCYIPLLVQRPFGCTCEPSSRRFGTLQTRYCANYVSITYTLYTHPFDLLHADPSSLWDGPPWRRNSCTHPSPHWSPPSVRDAMTTETLHLTTIEKTHLTTVETPYDSVPHLLHLELPRWRRNAFPISNSIALKARESHLEHVLIPSTRLLVDWVMARMEWTRRCDLRRD